MIKFVVLIVSLIFFGLATRASAQTEWKNWGSAPYATSEAEAMDKLPDALKMLGIPEQLHEDFIKMVRQNPQGTMTYLNPDDLLAAMMSGGSTPHAMTDVSVAAVPIKWRGRDDTVVMAAKARYWELESDGRVYRFILPEVCFNWSYQVEVLPEPVIVQAPPEKCAAIVFDTQPGDKIHVAYWSDDDRLPRSPCWGLIDGGRISQLPSPCDECDWRGLRRYITDEDIVEQNRYVTKIGGDQVLIVPVSQTEHYTSICITRQVKKGAEPKQSCSVTVEPVGKNNRRRVSKSRDDWEKPQGKVVFGGNPITIFSRVPTQLFVWKRRCPGE